MGLLSPWFLAGALAVGLPLWLHLMRRRNPVRMPFSSLMFFRKRMETTVRERRLRYLLLLALRLLLLLLLAFAFAKPVWERPPAAVLGAIPKLHIVALDTSLSMRYGDRWERAVTAADSIFDSLGPGDRAVLLANGPSVRVLTFPTSDAAALRRALAGLEPTHARNSFGDVIEAVRNLAAEERAPVELHLVSDFQQSSMPVRFQDLVLPENAELSLHAVGGESANWAIDGIKGSRRMFGQERPVLEATVASFAGEPATKTVTLQIGGATVGSLRREVPAGGRASFAFEIPSPPRGFSRAEFRLGPPDDLPEDDLRRTALDNSEPVPLLLVSQEGRDRDALYYRAALEAGLASTYRFESASVAEAARLDPGRYALVVLSDVAQLESGFEARLRGWVESGGAVLTALGPSSALQRRAALTGHELRQPLSSERGGAPFHVAGEMDASHPVARAAEGFRPAKFFLYLRVEPREGDSVPVRLGNGDPLLVEHELGGGRVLLFASSLDNVWNDLPLTASFVPFVDESARHLAGEAGAGGEALLGSVLDLDRRRGGGSSVQVIGPSGDRQLTLSDSVRREAVVLASIGFYEVRGKGRSELLGVNPDPRESDLLPVDDHLLDLWRDTGRKASGAAGKDGADPPEAPPWRIWRLLLWLLASAVLLESLVGNRHLDAARGD